MRARQILHRAAVGLFLAAVSCAGSQSAPAPLPRRQIRGARKSSRAIRTTPTRAHGRHRPLDDALPVEGALVAIGDRVVLTKADGAYRFTDVDVPYDVLVRDGLQVSAFLGITRRGLNLLLGTKQPRPSWSARVTTLLPPAPATVFLAEGNNVTQIEREADGLLVHWRGSYSQWVVLHAVAYDLDEKSHGFHRATSDTPGSTSIWWRTRPLFGRESSIRSRRTRCCSSPARLRATRRPRFDAFLDVGGTTRVSLGPFAGSPKTILLPSLSNGRVWMQAQATHGAEISNFVALPLDVNASRIEMPFDVAPALVAPADGASGSSTGAWPPFEWSQAAGANQLLLVPEASDAPTFVITTSGSVARVPRPDVLGLTLPRNARYHWRVRHWEYTEGGADHFACFGFDNRFTRSETSAPRLWTSPH